MPRCLFDPISFQHVVERARAAEKPTQNNDQGHAVRQRQQATEAIKLRVDGRISVHLLIVSRIPYIRTPVPFS